MQRGSKVTLENQRNLTEVHLINIDTSVISSDYGIWCLFDVVRILIFFCSPKARCFCFRFFEITFLLSDYMNHDKLLKPGWEPWQCFPVYVNCSFEMLYVIASVYSR